MNIDKKRLIILALLFTSPSVLALDAYFNQSGSQMLDLEITYAGISDLSFDITGNPYNSSYPANVTIDVGNDGIIDWEYKVSNSTELVNLEYVTNVWSSDSNGYIDVINASTGAAYPEAFAGLWSGEYIQNPISMEKGLLGLFFPYQDVAQQVVSVTTENATIHAFVPYRILTNGDMGLYVTRGGSTYYCNSNKEADGSSNVCDLTPAQAINDANIAMAANAFDFRYKEKVRNRRMVETINSNLSGGCSSPCGIPVKVSLEGAGHLVLDNFNVTEAPMVPHANISVSESETDYTVTIQPYEPLTEVSYFYGTKPNVYVVPFEAENEARTLNSTQIARLEFIENTLAEAWDNLTNHTHPLNFKFYTSLTPYKARGCMIGDDYDKCHRAIKESIKFKHPAIFVGIDVWDYFQNAQPGSFPTANGGEADDYGLIGDVYVNGFYNMSKIALGGYESEIVRNVLLHEIAHTFMGYPTNYSLVTNNHPACFRSDSMFESYPIANSPSGSEGYYEIYSVMNPVRIYTVKSSLGGRDVGLSALDRMLLGVLNPEEPGNYTFYSGTVSLQGGAYTASAMGALYKYDLESIYRFNEDALYWDVRSNSTKVSVGTSTIFTVPKSEQDGRALWVYAKDRFYQNHFIVYNNESIGSESKIASDNVPPALFITSPKAYNVVNCYPGNPSTPAIVSVGSDENLSSCEFIDYWNGIEFERVSMAVYENLTGASYGSLYMNDGYHNITVRCADSEGNINMAEEQNIIVDNYGPGIDYYLLSADNEGFTNETKFVMNISVHENTLKNVTYFLCNRTECQTKAYSTNVEGVEFSPLPLGRYVYGALACGYSDRCASTENGTLIVYDEGKFILDYDEWDWIETADIFSFNRTMLHRIEGMNFSNSFGRINFLDDVNLSHSGTWDLRGQIRVAQDNILVNTSTFPQFNHSARIMFRNVEMAHPMLFIDGMLCREDVCFNQTFDASASTFTSDVNHFSQYSLVEQCSDGIQDGDESGTDCGGSCGACGTPSDGGISGGGRGGGGGGRGGLPPKNVTNSTAKTNVTSAQQPTNAGATGNQTKNNSDEKASPGITGNVARDGLFGTRLRTGTLVFSVLMGMVIVAAVFVVRFMHRAAATKSSAGSTKDMKIALR